MKTRILLPLFLLLCAAKLEAQINLRDSLALVNFYYTANGQNWRNHANWLTIKPVSTWANVTVSNQRVTSLIFTDNHVSGYINDSLGYLDSLVTLIISNQNDNVTYYLHGNIPSSLFNLKKLMTIDLTNNQFSGSIPANVGNAASLQKLYLRSNKLTGGLSSTLVQLKNLTQLFVGSNMLTGNIPSDIGMMDSLTDLNIEYNQISGSIPSTLGNCSKLSSLVVKGNALTGKLPFTFQKLLFLTSLDAGNNQLSGPLQNVFAANSLLSNLNLISNQYSGKIPDFLSKLPKLEFLNLAYNQFSGAIPASLPTSTSIREIYLSNNQLTGKIPAAFATMPLLTSLGVSYNHLTGNIPPKLGTKLLAALDVSYNNLSGDLVNFFSTTSPYPEYLSIIGNHFTCSRNVQWSGTPAGISANADHNNFTFNGLEYLAKKYFNTELDSQAILHISIVNNTLSVNAKGTPAKVTYQWFKTGISGAVFTSGDTSFQPAASGRYYAKITDSKINNSLPPVILYTDTVMFTKTALMADVQRMNDLKITIAPNPVQGLLMISGLNDKVNAKITLADMSGYVWLSTISHRQVMLKLDVSRLKAGNYLVNVNDGKEVKTVQFVKE